MEWQRSPKFSHSSLWSFSVTGSPVALRFALILNAMGRASHRHDGVCQPVGKKDALNLHVGPHIHIVIYIYRIYIYIYIKLYIYIHIYIYIWPVYIHIYIYLSLSLLNLGFEFTNVCVTPCSLVFVYPFGLVEWRSRALWISQYEYSPPSLWRCIWMKSLNQCAILPFVHTWEL